MRIYIGTPTSLPQEKQITLQRTFVGNLKQFYRAFPESDIFFYSNVPVSSVHVMDEATFPGYDNDITSIIKQIMQVVLNISDTQVYLNYQQFNPNFNPCATQPKTDTATPTSSKNTQSPARKPSSEFDYEKLAENYHAEEPRYSFDQVILPDALRTSIEEAVSTILVEHKVFDEWGLRAIIPNASSALSFYGPPGTGKSMAAEAIAQKLNKKILRATYADIESKYLGEGPKMVKAIFYAAQRDDAVLFLDESDSLLSKRLTNTADSTAQSINSMRSQLLICLEQFKGIVVFATNLVVNYDKAFLSRLINIGFTKPDQAAREAIWYQHLKGKGLRIPLAEDVDITELAEKYEFCGREIKNSVKDACVVAAIAGQSFVTQANLIKAAEKTKVEYEKVLKAEDHTSTKPKLSPEAAADVQNYMQKKIQQAETVNVSKLNEV